MMTTTAHARAYLAAEFSVLPVRADGSKRPALTEWKALQDHLPTPEDLSGWWPEGSPHGVALVCGAVSGGLELIDFDHEAEAIFPRWWALLAEWPGIQGRVCVVRTPRPGYHVWLRCGEMETPGSAVLASMSSAEREAEKVAAAAEGRKPEYRLIETRGEGGYALAPGCPPACHQNNAGYEHHVGCLLVGLPSLSMDERDFLMACARSFDRDVPAPEPLPRSSPEMDLRPGDDFDARGWDWADVLTAHGWRQTGGGELGERRWARPGKSRGWSATTGRCSSNGSDLLRVFSSSADPFTEGKSYGKFRAFALLNHGGDLKAAAKALAGQGFGRGRSSGRPGSNGAFAFVPPPSSDPGQQQQSAGDVPPPLPSCFTHDELLDAKFPPQTWLLDSLVPAGGLVILGGKKKLGKSWLCLQIAQAVAQGAATLGRRAVAGAVAYVCLEDGERRLQDRLLKQKSVRGLPIRWFTAFTKLDAGGLAQLEALLQTGPRLVIIDTLAAAKTGKVDENSSGPMGDIGNELRRLAQAYNCAVVVTHHHGKFSYGDPGDDLRGSSALAAAADMNLGLYRVEDGHRLRGEGRDVEAFDWAVTFDANDSWHWKLIGDARVVAKEEADEGVLFALSSLGEATAAAVASAIGRSEQKTRDRLNALVQTGKVLMRVGKASGRGAPPTLYRLPPADANFNPFEGD